ncbi:hypothetical protein [uncultured Allofournierella sp.]|uniref:hypothetical protein n=1 Tax=uncultured Allofournierella sp. TaxID=1940258 RepID=UPI003751FD70
MKRLMQGFAAVLAVALLAGCGSAKSSQSSAALATPTPTASPEPVPELWNQPSQSPAEQSTPDGVDVDLVGLSSTVLYGEMFNIMMLPDEYTGKTIRVMGQFTVYDDLAPDRLMFTVMVADALACCQQGMEFVWDEGVYPEDYPEPGTLVTVTGVYESYQSEYGQSYRLKATQVEW